MGRPTPLTQRLSLDRLEEGFDSRVVVAIPSSAHRRLEAMLAQDFLIVVGTELAAAVLTIGTTLQQRLQRDGHVQRPDGQVSSHAIANRRANHAPGPQIEDDNGS